MKDLGRRIYIKKKTKTREREDLERRIDQNTGKDREQPRERPEYC